MGLSYRLDLNHSAGLDLILRVFSKLNESLSL